MVQNCNHNYRRQEKYQRLYVHSSLATEENKQNVSIQKQVEAIDLDIHWENGNFGYKNFMLVWSSGLITMFCFVLNDCPRRNSLTNFGHARVYVSKMLCCIAHVHGTGKMFLSMQLFIQITVQMAMHTPITNLNTCSQLHLPEWVGQVYSNLSPIFTMGNWQLG